MRNHEKFTSVIRKVLRHLPVLCHLSLVIQLDNGTLAAKEIRIRFGKALREARLAASMTQQEVAKASGITEANISRIERGMTNPSLDIVDRLAMAVGMSADVKLLAASPPSRKTKN